MAAPTTATLTRRDRLGALRVRLGLRRDAYRVEPGLYALGQPGAESPVLVSANYKLSFDALRAALPGRDAWILVLDTRGVNVWCAAGKGTFGTAEVVRRVGETRLAEVVTHRRLILPQLGAPGVAAHEVRKATGFAVTWGPIRAADLPAFLDAGGKATPAMRRKTFDLRERVVLIPVEMMSVLKALLLLVPLVLFLGGLGAEAGYWAGVRTAGLTGAVALLAAALAGAAAAPVLLPWLPGRAFAVKGLWTGLAAAAAIVGWRMAAGSPGGMDLAAWALVVPALSSFLAMNFTGSTTYTSLSGVRREMRVAVPLQAAAGAVGLVLWGLARFGF